ncbi:DnaJ domain-containing protein [Flexibacterium corallicola]|uniref:DnaJ domain-containing protein n=1 Tax=Flexibacterium corallicola TaxID=3037259 RepID=UPI00286F6EF0|nr:DnaJ domain-containing protein [Pseudovibrio sp. M1P-2-3]
MAYLVAGLLLLLILLYAAGTFSGAKPADIIKRAKVLLAICLLAVSVVLAFTGRWAVAAPIAAFALSLFGIGKSSLLSRFTNFAGIGSVKSKGGTSSVRTASLDMVLDHDTGDLDGEVTRGELQGRTLSSLDVEELELLWASLRLEADSLDLLETYLDSRLSNWRVNFKPDGTAGHSQPAGTGTLTEQEAYKVLGLSPGASAGDIRTAHRRLIKRVHPDSGGSAFLASKLNEAKDLLLNRH